MHKGNYRHGGHGTRLYTIWRDMRARCRDPKGSRHMNYYDRGIKVCSSWDISFTNFREWALNNGYRDDLSIDRIDNTGDYEPDNCRWVDYTKQNNNRSTNRYIEHNGEVHTVAEWARIKGVGYDTLWARLKRGWDIEKALSR